MKVKKLSKSSPKPIPSLVKKQTRLIQFVTKSFLPLKFIKKHVYFHILSSIFWFFVGFFFAASILSSMLLLYFHSTYKDKVIPGVYVDNMYVGGKTKTQIETIFNNKNDLIGKNLFEFSYKDQIATISANTLAIGYDSKLISDQAISLGKGTNLLSDIYLVLHSYIHGVYLQPSYTFNAQKLQEVAEPFQKEIFIEPQDALFTVEGNRVTAFRESSDGRTLDYETLRKSVQSKVKELITSQSEKTLAFQIPVKILKPDITTEKANKFGIVEVIGSGVSYFAHSIPNRIYNITLAASRVNGILVAPGEVFSFDKYLGDVSKLTGYKEAYVIQSGKTVLGDGGGVCQVSTTLFRALLNAGLPITERHAHAYRVGYYEQQSPPGLDATVFYPSVDLKFKNDTGNYILIQSSLDQENLMLTYTLYGKKDDREVSITTPVITSQTPPLPPLYQDDPTLAKGEVKQVDFEAWGAHVVFKRKVKKNGNVIIDETYNSRYAPWQAVFLKGTKEG